MILKYTYNKRTVAGKFKLLTKSLHDADFGRQMMVLTNPVWELNQNRIAVASRASSFCFMHMSFGLQTVQATLQRTLEKKLSEHYWQTCLCLVYVVDVIIYSIQLDNHAQAFDTVLYGYHKKVILLRFEKTARWKTLINCLRHVISSGRFNSLRRRRLCLQLTEALKDATWISYLSQPFLSLITALKNAKWALHTHWMRFSKWVPLLRLSHSMINKRM